MFEDSKKKKLKAANKTSAEVTDGKGTDKPAHTGIADQPNPPATDPIDDPLAARTSANEAQGNAKKPGESGRATQTYSSGIRRFTNEKECYTKVLDEEFGSNLNAPDREPSKSGCCGLHRQRQREQERLEQACRVGEVECDSPYSPELKNVGPRPKMRKTSQRRPP
jgi:hypothetical protein